MVILTALGFGRWVPLNKVHVEGITELSLNDIIYAKVHGFVDGTLRERSVKLSQWPQEIFPGDKVRIFTTDKGETTLEKIIPGWGP